MGTDRASETWSLDSLHLLQTEHSGKYRRSSASGVEGALGQPGGVHSRRLEQKELFIWPGCGTRCLAQREDPTFRAAPRSRRDRHSSDSEPSRARPPRCCSMVGRTGTSSSDDLVQRRLVLVADSPYSEAKPDTEGAVLSACPACVHGLWCSVRRKAWQQVARRFSRGRPH